MIVLLTVWNILLTVVLLVCVNYCASLHELVKYFKNYTENKD